MFLPWCQTSNWWQVSFDSFLESNELACVFWWSKKQFQPSYHRIVVEHTLTHAISHLQMLQSSQRENMEISYHSCFTIYDCVRTVFCIITWGITSAISQKVDFFTFPFIIIKKLPLRSDRAMDCRNSIFWILQNVLCLRNGIEADLIISRTRSKVPTDKTIDATNGML